VDKAERKRLQREYSEKQKKAFYDALPMSKDLFCQLFDFLDERLSDDICRRNHLLSTEFLILISVKKLNPVRGFLQQAKEVPTTRAKKAR